MSLSLSMFMHRTRSFLCSVPIRCSFRYLRRLLHTFASLAVCTNFCTRNSTIWQSTSISRDLLCDIELPDIDLELTRVAQNFGLAGQGWRMETRQVLIAITRRSMLVHSSAREEGYPDLINSPRSIGRSSPSTLIYVMSDESKMNR